MGFIEQEVSMKGMEDTKLTLKKHKEFYDNPPTHELWTGVFQALARMYEFRFSVARHMQKTRQFPPYRAEYGVNTGKFKRALTQPSGAVGGVRIKRKWQAQYGQRYRHGEWVSGGVPGRAARKIGIRTRRAKGPSGVLAWFGAPGVKFHKNPVGGQPAETTDRKPPKPIKPANILLRDKDMTRLELRKFDMRIEKFLRRHLMNIR